jgi:hypothetical protein
MPRILRGQIRAILTSMARTKTGARSGSVREAHMLEILRSVTIVLMGFTVVAAAGAVFLYG